ncbi:hypothetical protein [Deinococcus aquaticus]|jgi:hypothetical protein|uniref:Uncharacterized protein n=2 Tax=Deinococcus TaxID=1298 RepID=A0ABQ2T075_9DEIO|nr:hypothetical protein GCM10008961_38410 [Deinococcus knuensis]
MSLLFRTEHPEQLLAALWDGVASGEITEWRRDSRGWLTQAAPRWARQAWLRPMLVTGGLEFETIAPQDTELTRATYAHYHASLAETFIRSLFAFYDEVHITTNATRLEAA